MSGFEVFVLGVGDAFTARHHTASLVLVCDGFHLAVDCPDRYREALASAGARSGRGVGIEAVDHLLLTHVHGDHMNGLEGLAFFKHFVEQKRLHLAVTPEVQEVLWDERLRASMGALFDGTRTRAMELRDYFEIVPLRWEEEHVLGPFRIRLRRTLHHVPTCAVRVQAAGRTFAYSSDTAFDPSLIDFLSSADLIVHETNFGPAHTPYEKLAELPEQLRRRMRLIHFPDEFDRASSAIVPLDEGAWLAV
jgi:ribonuclease BN (tRNA processing enzyme)